MKILISNKKGISLPLVIGLIVILMIASTSIFLLISRSFSGIQRIESSNRAYFAAESGLENALYELSAHFSGYQTPTLDSNEVRRDVFKTLPRHENQWSIESMDEDGNFEGELKEDEKLVLSFYQDQSGSNDLPDNQINTNTSNINQIDTSNAFEINFQIPFDGEDKEDYSLFFSGNSLNIDNDRDGSLNEDGKADTNTCGGNNLNEKDGDCDGLEDEDSPEDNVIFWQLYDSEGRILSPIPGCLSGAGTADDPSGTEICEKDFVLLDGKIQVQLDQEIRGLSESGEMRTIGNFIDPSYDLRSSNARIEMEFLISSPMVQMDASGLEKGIPYFEYLVDADAGISLPLPFFTIQSDGWYRDFKQSITTQVIPRTTAPILTITIIQNE